MNFKISVGLDLNYTEDLEKYFNLIDETKEMVFFYKINPAFFLNNREKIKSVVDYIKFCNCNWIYDGKIGDVPHTNKKYAEYLYEYLDADGATLNPYLGEDSLKPFFEYENKINFLLCRTTNYNSETIQDKVYKDVYNIANNLQSGLVIPGNKDGYLEDALLHCPKSLILSPGIGKQGGKTKNISNNIVFSISRSIINSKNPKEEMRKYVHC